MSQTTRSPSFTPGDLSGGTASAIVSITGNVAAGVIAFAPLGPEYTGQGILAGMFSSIVAGLMAALFGSAPGMIAGPKATTSMAFAALLSQLLATGRFDLQSPESMDLLLALAFGAVLISGSVQILLGAFRVGALVKFMPYPVVAGIRNTTAILLIYGQLWPFLGVPSQSVVSLFSDIGQIQPATAVVASVTAGIAWKGARFLPKASVPVVALVAGTLLHHLLQAAWPGTSLGPVFGSLPSAIPRPEYLGGIFAALSDGANLDLLVMVLGGALAMAVLDSISALITLVSYQSIADRRFDANNQLVGQGIGSAVAAFFGGLTTSGILARAAVNHNAGGRSRASGVVNALAVLALVVVLARPLALIPKAAVAGLIMVIASGLFDRWTVGQVKELRRTDGTKLMDKYLAVGEMVFVVMVGVFVNLVAAVGAGVALSVIVFVAKMSRSPIRRVRTGATVRSTRRRAEHLVELLSSEGHRIAIIELEGTIFFGSCDSLATRAEDLADDGAEFILLDLKRVGSVDATGYKVLGQTFQRLRTRGTTLAFSYVTSGGINAEIAEDLVLNGVPEARMFESTDVALEYFEEGLLLKLGADAGPPGGWTLSDFGKSWGMDDDECAILDGYIGRRRFVEGEFVVKDGGTGRSMFLVASGNADVSILTPGESRRLRLATFSEGTVFGEMALLDGSPRAAAVQATGPLELLELSYEALSELGSEHPEIAVKIQGAIGRILGARLRGANALILELDS